jgi:hypothetical protein
MLCIRGFLLYAVVMDAEVREMLSRHGMTAEDIERMAEFEATVRKPRKRVRVEQTALDFGDWA